MGIILGLHAGVTTKTCERKRLEQVCRYIARPSVAEEWLSTDNLGNMIYKFKKHWDDGTTALKPPELNPVQDSQIART